MTAALLERERPSVRARAATSRSSSPRSRPSQPAPARSGRPKLRVLDRRAVRQRARRRHALLTLFIVMLVGFFAVAFVHAELVADQHELDGIRARIAEAEAHNASVARATEEASSPVVIVSRAQELGMVRAFQPVYLAAAVPVREMPTSISFTGRPDTITGFAAPATAAELTIVGGVSGTAAVNAQDMMVEDAAENVAAPALAPAGQEAVAQRPTPAESPIQWSAPVEGSPVSISGAAVATGSPDVVETTTQPSIAGTRAVSAGQQGSEFTNRLGGTNAGTGSG